ncbi:hypothetical protein OPV22_015524 [Ensete ventricosum]|uniref:Uncharacterized protein n=1 Tax=Ensete ventricosum TaxID=4639 RepID=A0AAV8R5Q8_ENSVE|nr:hypothetical protein OPV22_015524 [Ensete ventricosum]
MAPSLDFPSNFNGEDLIPGEEEATDCLLMTTKSAGFTRSCRRVWTAMFGLWAHNYQEIGCTDMKDVIELPFNAYGDAGDDDFIGTQVEVRLS